MIGLLLAATLGAAAGDTVQASRNAEVVAYFILTAVHPANGDPQFDDAIRSVKTGLAKRAAARGASFAAVGIATDGDLQRGVDYLLNGKSGDGDLDFGAWQEIIVGRAWRNTGVVAYLWRSAGPAATPQTVIVERDVATTNNGLRVGADRVVHRIVGVKDLAAWVKNGMPVSEGVLAASGR